MLFECLILQTCCSVLKGILVGVEGALFILSVWYSMIFSVDVSSGCHCHACQKVLYVQSPHAEEIRLFLVEADYSGKWSCINELEGWVLIGRLQSSDVDRTACMDFVKHLCRLSISGVDPCWLLSIQDCYDSSFWPSVSITNWHRGL